MTGTFNSFIFDNSYNDIKIITCCLTGLYKHKKSDAITTSDFLFYLLFSEQSAFCAAIVSSVSPS